jgi:hypothetical protein
MSISSVNPNVSTSVNNSQSEALKTLLSSVTNQPTLLGMLSEDGTNTTSSSDDILDLSASGQAAADQLYQLLSSLELNSVQASVDKAGASVEQKLNKALSASGIDTSQQIDLQVDSDGNVAVTNDNPQKQQIEDTINNNPDLKKAVVQYLNFMHAMAPTLENDNNIQNSFSGDIGQLLSSFGANGSGNSSQGAVTLTLQGTGFQTSYQDAGGQSSVLSSSQAQ